jgi:hypothetical protein
MMRSCATVTARGVMIYRQKLGVETMEAAASVMTLGLV